MDKQKQHCQVRTTSTFLLLLYTLVIIWKQVVDKNNKFVPFGTPGELCIRGYCNMLEYWDDKEKANELLAADRWLHNRVSVLKHFRVFSSYVCDIKCKFSKLDLYFYEIPK